MEKDTYQYFRKWFSQYVRSFYSDDPYIAQNIKLKEYHSLRVCQNASLICGSEQLPDDELYLAMTIALFHDIGRFEQFQKYRTFKDSESENHALLSVNILKSEKVLSSLTSEEQEMIFTAISHHNAKKLPQNLNRECLFHCRLVRDADKLDILKVLDDHYSIKDKSPNPALELGLPDIPEYSHYMVDDILNNRISSTAGVRTCNDLRLSRLAWSLICTSLRRFVLLRKKGTLKEQLLNCHRTLISGEYVII